jgi:hypothetical protein
MIGNALDKLLAIAQEIWDSLGRAKTKNRLLGLLSLMTAFGMIAPGHATAIRDALMAIAF